MEREDRAGGSGEVVGGKEERVEQELKKGRLGGTRG